VLRRLVLAAVSQKWVLDYLVPLGQILVGTTWKRMARHVPFHRGDLAIGTELFTAALAVWMAVLATIHHKVHGLVDSRLLRLEQSNLELGYQLFILTGFVLLLLPHVVRLFWLDPADQETPTLIGVVVQDGLGILAMLNVFFATTHWLLPGSS
jgi:hypothetical protein